MSGRRRLGVTLTAALCALALAPAAALAHAQLEGTSPASGADLRQAPALVEFRFDEPVEGNLGAVRVYDASGRRVDRGDAFHPGGAGSRFAVHLQPGLPQGTCTATYRVISADGHVVSGGFSFSIGTPSATTTTTVAGLLSASRTGPVTTAVHTVARAVQFAAIALAVGAAVFLLAVWRGASAAVNGAGAAGGVSGIGDAGGVGDAALRRRVRRVLLVAATAGAVSAAAGIVLEGAEAAGVSGFSALRWPTIDAILGTRFGTVWGLGVVAWLLVAALAPALTARPPAERSRAGADRDGPARGASDRAAAPERAGAGRRERSAADRATAAAPALVAVPLGFLVLLPALSGHGSTQSPVGVLLPSIAIHVAAMGTWVGGLVALVACLPAATRALPSERRGALLAAVLVRFSPLALAAVGALLVTGLVQSYVLVRSLDNLLHTGYGRDVLAKLLLLCALGAIGAWHRRRGIPRLRAIAAAGSATGATGLHVRRALRTEVALLAAVLAVTGVLAGAAPAIARRQGPFDTTRTVGPARLELTVDPARVGANAVHLYLFDARTGAQYTSAKEVGVDATLPAKGIGPLHQDASLAGPGHYVIAALPLAPGGSWRVTVTVRVSDFDEYATSVMVPVR